MCKNPKWLAIAILAAMDCKEKKPEETKWGSSFCFYDLSPKGRSMLYANEEGRGILICPGVITPVVTPWEIAVCCRAAAENLMQIRAKENVCLYGAIRSMDIHLADHISSTIEQLGSSHLNNQALTVVHEDIMMDTLRKAMIGF
jgi:hypothetical protein